MSRGNKHQAMGLFKPRKRGTFHKAMSELQVKLSCSNQRSSELSTRHKVQSTKQWTNKEDKTRPIEVVVWSKEAQIFPQGNKAQSNEQFNELAEQILLSLIRCSGVNSFGQPCKRFRFKFFIIKKSYEWG